MLMEKYKQLTSFSVVRQQQSAYITEAILELFYTGGGALCIWQEVLLSNRKI